MTNRTTPFALLLLLASLTGCVHGDAALREHAPGDREPDVKQLVRALGKRPWPLLEYSWVPFIRMSVQEFDRHMVQAIEASDSGAQPTNASTQSFVCYSLGEGKMYGPFYAVSNRYDRYYDANGTLSSLHETHSILWHLFGSEVWQNRREDRWEESRKTKYLFGLFSSESPTETVAPPPGTEAPAL